MTTNRLARSADGDDRVVAPSDPHARRTFWIERGNTILRDLGRHNLQWVCRDGFYFIEERN